MKLEVITFSKTITLFSSDKRYWGAEWIIGECSDEVFGDYLMVNVHRIPTHHFPEPITIRVRTTNIIARQVITANILPNR